MKHHNTKQLLHCPHDIEDGRVYYKLCGGRVELQTKGNGSTARIAFGEDRQAIETLTVDAMMLWAADALYTQIEEYSDAKCMNARLDEQSHIIQQLSTLPKDTPLEQVMASLRTKMRIERLQVKGK